MDYERTGRKIGIGLRVFGRVANQRLDAATRPVPLTAEEQQTQAEARSETERRMRERGAAAGQTAGKVKQGGRRFGAALFSPVARAGHSLFLEIAGVFFALFGVYFLESGWRLRSAPGPEHARSLTYLVLGVVFAYFSVTSFVRARRRQRR